MQAWWNGMPIICAKDVELLSATIALTQSQTLEYHQLVLDLAADAGHQGNRAPLMLWQRVQKEEMEKQLLQNVGTWTQKRVRSGDHREKERMQIWCAYHVRMRIELATS